MWTLRCKKMRKPLLNLEISDNLCYLQQWFTLRMLYHQRGQYYFGKLDCDLSSMRCTISRRKNGEWNRFSMIWLSRRFWFLEKPDQTTLCPRLLVGY